MGGGQCFSPHENTYLISTQLIFGNIVHISNMIFIASDDQFDRATHGRLEKWENGTEKMEVFRKCPEKRKHKKRDSLPKF